MEKEKKSIDTNNKFIIRLIKWLEEKGFANDRGWDKPRKDGSMFYSFGKGRHRVNITQDWDKSLSFYVPLTVSFLDCEKEYNGAGLNFKGMLGQTQLIRLEKTFTRPLFDELCKHYGITGKKSNHK